MRRERCLFAAAAVDHLSGSRGCGMSSASALLSWPDLRSTPDRRSPVSCFSASDRVSVPDRRSFAGSSIVTRPLLIAAHRGLRGVAENHAGSGKLWHAMRPRASAIFASVMLHRTKVEDSRGGAAGNWIALILNRSAAGTKGAAELFTEWQCTGDWSLRCGAWLFWQRLRCW